MKDLTEEVGTKACLVDRVVKIWMKWAGYMVRMKDERLLNSSETRKQGSCRTCRRPQLRWNEYLKADLRKAEEE